MVGEEPLTWLAGASSKWQFVFHLGTIRRLATLHHPCQLHRVTNDKMPATNNREYYITHGQRG